MDVFVSEVLQTAGLLLPRVPVKPRAGLARSLS
jgi:hypothetical protein